MKKSRKKNRAKLFDSKVQAVLIVTLLALLFIFGGAIVATVFFDLPETAQKWLNLLTGSVDAFSVFLVPVLSIWVTRNVIRSKDKLEEELKIEPDHHKIVCQYVKHLRNVHKDADGNKINKDGVMTFVTNVACGETYNPEKDPNSDAYFVRQKEINDYKNGRLQLPAADVFANCSHKTQIVFDDSTEFYELPPLLKENAAKLISAHKASKVTNSTTVRLNDFSYDNGVLTLKTKRSKYLDMLMTNRCMDFDLDGMSVRCLYEPESKVTPLKDSQLCNQIGINGLVYTADNYLLIEKRGSKKAIWKNKFAQPISLALKLKDLATNADGKLGGKAEDAENNLKSVISKTLKSNFGLVAKTPEQKGDYDFTVPQNFMGIARDLLEGGKPNMYFYVKLNLTAQQLKERLENSSRIASVLGDARSKLALGVKMQQDGLHKVTVGEIEDKNKKPLQKAIANGFVAVEQADGKVTLSLAHGKPLISEQKDAALALLDKMEQAQVDKQLEELMSKYLPKVNKDKLDSQFYLVKREDVALDYDYAANLPADKILGVQRAFYPCVSAAKEKLEKMRLSKYGENGKGGGLRRECGEALLTCLYYAAQLQIENL